VFLPAVASGGVVEGVVRLQDLPPVQPGAQYRTRARHPVLPADAARAVVWLETTDGHYPRPVPAGPVHIAQQGYQFRPGILAVQVGSEVRFPNQDEEFHSVFSYSQTKRFDLGRYRRDEETPPVVFDRAGVVKIYCEIHKHMRSIVLVLESPWFAVTDPEGRFRLDGVPAGAYVLRAWLPTDHTLQQPVSVDAMTPARVDLGPG
jgi:plastocyanin